MTTPEAAGLALYVLAAAFYVWAAWRTRLRVKLARALCADADALAQEANKAQAEARAIIDKYAAKVRSRWNGRLDAVPHLHPGGFVRLNFHNRDSGERFMVDVDRAAARAFADALHELTETRTDTEESET